MASFLKNSDLDKELENIEKTFLEELYNLNVKDLEDLEGIATLNATENINDSILYIFTKTNDILKKNEKYLELIYDKLQAQVSSPAVSVVSSPISSVASSSTSSTSPTSSQPSSQPYSQPSSPRSLLSSSSSSSLSSSAVSSRASSPVNIQEGLKKVATDKVITSVVENNVQNTAKDVVTSEVVKTNIEGIATNTVKKLVGEPIVQSNDLEEQIKNKAIELVKQYSIEYQYAGDPPRKQVGIENSTGSQCYANASIQMLYSLPYYRNYYSKKIDANNDPDTTESYISQLFKVINRTEQKKSAEAPSYSLSGKMCPLIIKEMVTNKNNAIRQEDATEYILLFIFKYIHQEPIKYTIKTLNTCSNGKPYFLYENTKGEDKNENIISININGDNIQKCMDVYVNEKKPYDKSHTTAIKKLIIENLDKTIRILQEQIPVNVNSNKQDITMIGTLNYIANGTISKNLITEEASLNKTVFESLKEFNNKINIAKFNKYITYNKYKYYYENKNENENDYVENCANYNLDQQFDSVKEFKDLLKTQDYLVGSTGKKIVINIPPENRYLFIQLKRFDNDRKKIKGSVEPNKTLIIGGVKYTLSGVIVHDGDTIASGHYIFIQCNKNGGFNQIYDDSKFSPFNEGQTYNTEFINENGYIFAYTRYPVEENNPV
jgi:hypothetical protein